MRSLSAVTVTRRCSNARWALLGLVVLSLLATAPAPASATAGVRWDRTWGQNVDSVNASTGLEVCTFRLNCTGGTGSGGAGSVFPAGIAAGPSGHVYVAEYAWNRIHEFDAGGGFVRMWGRDVVSGNGETGFEVCASPATCKAGTTGGAGGEFTNPFGVATDSSGNVYVTDQNSNRVQEFTATGGFIRAFGRDVSTGTAGTELEVCTVASDCKVGLVTATISGGGRGGFLAAPSGIGVDPSGYVYVANQGARRVERFTPAATFDRAWGQGVVTAADVPEICTVAANCTVGKSGGAAGGSGAGGFVGLPTGLAVDAGANVYVFESTNLRMEKFTAQGAFIAAWGKNVDAVAGGTGFEVCTVSARCQFSTPGTAGGAFLNAPAGPNAPPVASVAVGPSGTVYVTDRENARMQAFDSGGNFLLAWGTNVNLLADPGGGFQTCFVAAQCGAGSEDGSGGGMQRPTGVAAAADGTIYESDQIGLRIQAFSCPSGTVSLSSASYGSGESGNATVTVTRTGDDACPATARYATANGTATAGSDYTATQGTVTIPAGASSQNIQIPITDDSLRESSETFTLTLSSPGSGATLGSPSATTVTITDDDVVDTLIDSAPSGFLTDLRFRFVLFRADPAAGATFTCWLDNEAPAACSNPYDPGATLADGPHTFSVRAALPVGQPDASPATGSFFVDTVRPETAVSVAGTQLPGGKYAGPVTINATATDAVPGSGVKEVLCIVDPAVVPQTAADMQDACPVTVTAPGSHTVYAAAIDNAGWQGVPVKTTFTTLALPDTTITSGPDGEVWGTSAQFGFTSTIAGSTFRCRLDGSTFTPCSAPATIGPLKSGDHVLDVAAVSPEGVTDATPASRSFRVGETKRKLVTCRVEPFTNLSHYVSADHQACAAFVARITTCAGFKCVTIPDCPALASCTLKTTAQWYDADPTALWQVGATAAVTGSPVQSSSCAVSATGDRCRVSHSVTFLGTASAASYGLCQATAPINGDYGQAGYRRLECEFEFTIEPSPALATTAAAASVSVLAPGSGTMTVAPGAAAKGASAAARTAPFKTMTMKATGPGPIKLTPKLSSASLRTLRRTRRLRLSLKITFKPLGGGPAQTATRKVTLSRPKPLPGKCPKRAPSSCAAQLAVMKAVR